MQIYVVSGLNLRWILVWFGWVFVWFGFSVIVSFKYVGEIWEDLYFGLPT